jgi:hypothetical protein
MVIATSAEVSPAEALRMRILDSAKNWLDPDEEEDRAAVPYDEPGFDRSLRAAMPELQALLGEDLADFLAEILQHGCTLTRVDRSPDRQRTALFEYTLFFLPVLGAADEIAALTEHRLAAIAEALDESGLAGATGRTTILPTCVTLETLATLPYHTPAAILSALSRETVSFDAVVLPTDDDLHEAARPFGPPDRGATGSIAVRCLIGLRVRRTAGHVAPDDEPFEDRLARDRFLRSVKRIAPNLTFAAPGGAIDTARRMIARKLEIDLAQSRALHGLEMSDSPDTIWLHYTREAEGEALDIVAEHGMIEIGPIRIAPWIATLGELDIDAVLDKVGCEVVISEDPYDGSGRTAH